MKQIILHILQMIYRCIYKTINKKKAFAIPILTFHWFVNNEIKENDPSFSTNHWYASIDVFEGQIKWLVERGYEFIDSFQLREWMNHKIELPVKSVMLTFDDGEISQLRDIPIILKKYGAKATIFVVGKYWKNEDSKIPCGCVEDKIEHFSKKDYYNCPNKDCVEIQAHTYNLHYKKGNKRAINLISDEEFIADIEKMRDEGFECIAMPYGAYSKNTIKILSKYYELGFSFPGRKSFPYASRISNKYRLPRIRVEGSKNVEDLKKYL